MAIQNAANFVHKQFIEYFPVLDFATFSSLAQAA